MKTSAIIALVLSVVILCLHPICASGLAADLIEAAEQRYPDKVRFHFNTGKSRQDYSGHEPVPENNEQGARAVSNLFPMASVVAIGWDCMQPPDS